MKKTRTLQKRDRVNSAPERMGRTESELAHEVKTANIALAVTHRLSECQLDELDQLDELVIPLAHPPLKCRTCDKAFFHRDALDAHRLIHSTLNLFDKCHICNKKFSSKLKLNLHCRKHHSQLTVLAVL